MVLIFICIEVASGTKGITQTVTPTLGSDSKHTNNLFYLTMKLFSLETMAKLMKFFSWSIFVKRNDPKTH